MNELVLYERVDQTAVLTLNRPERRNALSRGLVAALDDAVRRAGDESDVRVLILTGTGPTFCAGMDLAELEASLQSEGAATPVWDDALLLARVYDRLYRLPKPSIAAINGAAVAGGAGLVTVCDLAVATTRSRLGYPEVKRGLVAAMVLPHLLRHVGERMARYLLLTGELIDAETALRSGLINAVVPAEQLREHALGLARQLCSSGPQALAQTRELLTRFSSEALPIEEAARASAAPRLTEECRQGLAAFFAKKDPPWVCSDPPAV